MLTLSLGNPILPPWSCLLSLSHSASAPYSSYLNSYSKLYHLEPCSHFSFCLRPFFFTSSRTHITRDPLNDYPLEKGDPPLSLTEDEMVGWHHQLQDMGLSKIREMVKDREAWHTAVHEVAKSWTWLSDWTEMILCHPLVSLSWQPLSP